MTRLLFGGESKRANGQPRAQIIFHINQFYLILNRISGDREHHQKPKNDRLSRDRRSPHFNQKYKEYPMKWQQVTELAASHGLAIYRPYCGFHKLAQITTTTGDPVGWTANKARLAHQSITAIIQQRGLSKLSDQEAIAAAQDAKAFFTAM